MVLCRRHHCDMRSVGKGLQCEFLPFQFFFDQHHPVFFHPGLRIGECIAQCGKVFPAYLYPLATGQAHGLDDHLLKILQRLADLGIAPSAQRGRGEIG